jgi:hypothetical protein
VLPAGQPQFSTSIDPAALLLPLGQAEYTDSMQTISAVRDDARWMLLLTGAGCRARGVLELANRAHRAEEQKQRKHE